MRKYYMEGQLGRYPIRRDDVAGLMRSSIRAYSSQTVGPVYSSISMTINQFGWDWPQSTRLPRISQGKLKRGCI